MSRACIRWKGFVGGVGLLAIFLALPQRSDAFAFTFASAANGVDIVTHPKGYMGASTPNLTISVGIQSGTAHSAEMVTSVQNAIATWNGLVPTTGNVNFNANVPNTQFDFESVLLHEMGHTLGLAHPNLGQLGGLTDAQTDYTNSTTGSNGTFNLNAGTDGVIGSKDDVRGDDVNLNYFHKSNNDPFTIASVVDSTTYSRNIADLPLTGGHLYSANPSRDVATLLGAGSTESVLQQGIFNGEARRTLGHDDVAGIKYAMSGLDEIAGTADDYTLTLTYAGITTTADILIRFQDGVTGFAVAQTGANGITADHFAVTTASIIFQDAGIPWFFNPVAVPEPGSLALMGVAAVAGIGAYVRRRRLTLQPSAKR